MKLEAIMNGRAVPFVIAVTLALVLGYSAGTAGQGFLTSGRAVFTLVLLIVAAVVLLDRVFAPLRDRRKLARFRDRAPISADEFYKTFYGGSALARETIVELRDEIAESIGVPAGLLRPQDRFDVELADEKVWWPDWGLDELSELAAERLKKLHGKVEADKIKTLDDYIKAFGSLESKRRARAS